MKIAIIGTDGIPARYGGFETFVEQVTPHLVSLGHEILIVGSAVGRHGDPPLQAGVEIVNLPMPANGASSVLFDVMSALLVRRKADAILVLGVSGGLFFPLIRLLCAGRPLVLNVDGLETQRAKWGGFKRKFLAVSEWMAIKCSDRVVSDNAAISELVKSKYQRSSEVIAYGNDHVLHINEADSDKILKELGLRRNGYLLTIARIEPENNIDMMVEAHLASKIDQYVIVGNFTQTQYGISLRARYGECARVKLINSIYDPEKLSALRSGALAYLHGHSVGGTNPSLVEVLPYGGAVLAFDCSFNRKTLREGGGYFTCGDDLSKILLSHDFEKFVPSASLWRDGAYQWRSIAQRYVSVLEGV